MGILHAFMLIKLRKHYELPEFLSSTINTSDDIKFRRIKAFSKVNHSIRFRVLVLGKTCARLIRYKYL